MSSEPWPEGKRFAFTVFDDPDSQPVAESRLIYGMLGDLGFRTTMGVWPAGPFREGNSRSDSCLNPAYLEHALATQARGFEIGYHGNALRTSPREETAGGLEAFRALFGQYPAAMANHYGNAEAIYWGPSRLSGLPKLIYRTVTGSKRANQFFGEVEGHPYFWGDLCQARIQYCRNFVFKEINTLARCPVMPYHDPARPFVRQWYAGSEGADAGKFLNTISEANQDQLEAEGGACIMYTHFGKGFVENGQITPRFRELMTRLAKKGGWYVPVTELLNHIRAGRGEHTLTDQERSQLEWRWLLQKLAGGTS